MVSNSISALLFHNGLCVRARVWECDALTFMTSVLLVIRDCIHNDFKLIKTATQCDGHMNFQMTEID